jgi:hypothetical protein
VDLGACIKVNNMAKPAKKRKKKMEEEKKKTEVDDKVDCCY